MTGWAQVNGNTLLSLDEKVALDLWYIDHAGLWLDLTILQRTLLVMIGGERRTKTLCEELSR
jgi:lipopolysaccharide/colanic/teichoic acid biosynthesis glycosyltransferase